MKHAFCAIFIFQTHSRPILHTRQFDQQITHDHSIIGTANDKSYDATHDNLSQIRRKECVELFKRNDVHLIIKVSVVCTGDNEQFLVIAGQLAVRCFAEIAGVRLLAVHQQHGGADLAGVLQNRQFINDSEDVTFQPPLEFRLRGW